MLGASLGLSGKLVLGMKAATLKADLDRIFNISKPISALQLPVPHPLTNEVAFSLPPLFDPTIRSKNSPIVLKVASSPLEPAPPGFRVNPNVSLKYILDTNVVPRRHRQLAAFMRRIEGPAMIASLPELEREIRAGKDWIKAMLRFSAKQHLFRSVPHKIYRKSDLPLPQATLWPADGSPQPTTLTADLRIRAELLALMRLFAAQIPAGSLETVVLFFLSFDLGHQRLATALPKVPGVELVIAHIVDDIAGPPIEDVMYGLAKPFVKVSA